MTTTRSWTQRSPKWVGRRELIRRNAAAASATSARPHTHFQSRSTAQPWTLGLALRLSDGRTRGSRTGGSWQTTPIPGAFGATWRCPRRASYGGATTDITHRLGALQSTRLRCRLNRPRCCSRSRPPTCRRRSEGERQGSRNATCRVTSVFGGSSVWSPTQTAGLPPLPISHREGGTHASPTSSPLGRRNGKERG